MDNPIDTFYPMDCDFCSKYGNNISHEGWVFSPTMELIRPPYPLYAFPDGLLPIDPLLPTQEPEALSLGDPNLPLAILMDDDSNHGFHAGHTAADRDLAFWDIDTWPRDGDFELADRLAEDQRLDTQEVKKESKSISISGPEVEEVIDIPNLSIDCKAESLGSASPSPKSPVKKSGRTRTRPRTKPGGVKGPRKAVTIATRPPLPTKRTSRREPSIESWDDESTKGSGYERLAHNRIERKYRTGLNGKFESLRGSLPKGMRVVLVGKEGGRKKLIGKADVLVAAMRYIKELEEKRRGLREESEVLVGSVRKWENAWVEKFG